MTDKEILQIALAQSAEDIGCKAEDFTKKETGRINHETLFDRCGYAEGFY